MVKDFLDRWKTRTSDQGAPADVRRNDDPNAVPAAQAESRPATPSSNADVDAFVAKMKAMAPKTSGARGRLIFAMDATMSRQPTWDMALSLQGDMFDAVKQVGGLDVQLVYFRGHNECRASKWVTQPDALARLMTTVSVAGGLTQVGKVFSHARQEAEKQPVSALVFVGDAFEEEIDPVCGRAGELALHGVPVFIFQEGHNGAAARAFAEIARLTKGAHCQFDAGSAAQLRALLAAVAVYASGGRLALENMSRDAGGRGAQLLLEQMK